MSPSESPDRLAILEQVQQKQLSQAAAARRLGLSVRHVKRLLKALRERGAAALVHGLTGQPSNRRIDRTVRAHATALLATEPLERLGPAAASAVLARDHGIVVSRETVRQWRQRGRHGCLWWLYTDGPADWLPQPAAAAAPTLHMLGDGEQAGWWLRLVPSGAQQSPWLLRLLREYLAAHPARPREVKFVGEAPPPEVLTRALPRLALRWSWLGPAQPVALRRWRTGLAEWLRARRVDDCTAANRWLALAGDAMAFPEFD